MSKAKKEMEEIVITEDEYEENNPEHIDRMLKKKSTLILAILVTLMPIALGLYYYDRLPEQIAMHFSFSGSPNRYMSKIGGIIVSPLIMAVIEMAIFKTSEISRKKGAGGVNLKGMNFMLWIIALLSIVVNVSIIYYNLGKSLDIVRIACIACGMIYVAIGNYIPKESMFPSEYMTIPNSLRNSEKKIRRVFGRTLVIAGLATIILSFAEVKIAGIVLISSGLLIVLELIYFIIINNRLKSYKK